jgi:hypothetical protein
MKLKMILAAIVFLLSLTGLARAKYFNESLTIAGPGLSTPIEIKNRRFLDRVYRTLLAGRARERAERPSSPGRAYELNHSFAIGDNDGSDSATIHQTLYPFAKGGPVVSTPRGERFKMSFGIVRFHPDWYEVPEPVLDRLQEAGLPVTQSQAQTRKVPELAPTAGARDNPSTKWQWVLGIAVAVMGAGIWAASRRRPA